MAPPGKDLVRRLPLARTPAARPGAIRGSGPGPRLFRPGHRRGGRRVDPRRARQLDPRRVAGSPPGRGIPTGTGHPVGADSRLVELASAAAPGIREQPAGSCGVARYSGQVEQHASRTRDEPVAWLTARGAPRSVPQQHRSQRRATSPSTPGRSRSSTKSPLVQTRSHHTPREDRHALLQP